MKYSISLIMTIHFSVSVLGQTTSRSISVQKAPIDSLAIANWSDLLWSEASVSADGKYFMYPIENLPVGSNTLVIQSTSTGWKKEFIGVSAGIFSYDSKQVIFKSSDSLFFVSLGKDERKYIAGVSSFTFPKTYLNNFPKNNGKVVAYKLKHSNDVIVKGLVNNQELLIQNVSKFILNGTGNVIIVMKPSIKSGGEELDWIDLVQKKTKMIWSNESDPNSSIINFQFDRTGSKLIFVTKKKKDERHNIIWQYASGKDSAEVKVSNELLRRSDDMIISSKPPSFSKNGNYIFFSLQRDSEFFSEVDPSSVQVDVWNYKDIILQPLQTYFNKKKENVPQHMIKSYFIAAMPFEGTDIRQLENDSQKIILDFISEEFVVVCPFQNYGDKVGRVNISTGPYKIVFLKDGRNKWLTNHSISNFWLSPNDQFLIFFDSDVKQYFSYNIISSVTKKLSESIPTKLINDQSNGLIVESTLPIGIAGWLDNGFFIVYNNYDLWMLDPSGKTAPKNITNNYGRNNRVKFDIIPDQGWPGSNAIYRIDRPLLLTAFWEDSKQNGFFNADINKISNPKLLSRHSSLVYTSSKQTTGINLVVSKAKADSANVWIVKKQTVAFAPNFFSTTDFKHFRQLTNMQPQKQYRWVTSELITWKTSEGKPCHGILYKPENLDSLKKHPVILYYYEEKSAELHQFLKPNFTDAALNIPWFCSRGYLVFVPDIHYTVGCVASSVVNSVAHGIRELIKQPFVDSSAIGIQGHSFGGYETNILVTEMNIFAAAVEGAGTTDLVSKFGSLLPAEVNNGYGSFHLEYGGQDRMNGLLWDNQKGYIENSPIFKVDKVTTPLLIMHNKNDNAVPWGQAVEFFIALRRLEKPVWMLQYDNESHGLSDPNNQMDYTYRITQFFDHFLKGSPAPKWMTQGIPTVMKGIKTGYDLDPSGNCELKEGKCKVCSGWNKQYRKTPVMFSKSISEWTLEKDN
jgi:dipeptidyl aminopeptidase/acylaminoacyl peptidase